jgi:hypothetical protein
MRCHLLLLLGISAHFSRLIANRLKTVNLFAERYEEEIIIARLMIKAAIVLCSDGE